MRFLKKCLVPKNKDLVKGGKNAFFRSVSNEVRATRGKGNEAKRSDIRLGRARSGTSKLEELTGSRCREKKKSKPEDLDFWLPLLG